MRRTLLSAALAAVFATACQDDAPPPRPITKVHRTTPVSAPPPVVAAAPSVVDAGMPTPPEVVDALAVSHEHRGMIDHIARANGLKDVGDFESALTEARRALHHDAADEEALALVSRISELIGNRELRLASLVRLAELHPEDALPLIRVARVKLGMGDTAGALVSAQEALLRDGQEPEAFHVMGRAYLNQGELQAAIDQFKKVIELSPHHGYALNNLGFTYLRTSQNEEAVEVLTRAAEILPAVAYVQNNLGVALERTGQVDAAKEAFTLATTLSPKYVKAHVNSQRLSKLVQAPVESDAQPAPEPSEE